MNHAINEEQDTQSLSFCPNLFDKTLFFSVKGFYFLQMIEEPISDFLSSEVNQENALNHLTKGQRVLYYFQNHINYIEEKGFLAFYLRYSPEIMEDIIVHFGEIDGEEVCEILKKAQKYYHLKIEDFKNIQNEFHKKRLTFDLNQAGAQDSIFEPSTQNSDSTFSEFESLITELLPFLEDFSAKVENFIRRNPSEFCKDENGDSLPNADFSGECFTTYPNNNLKQQFYLLNGEIHGELYTFFEDGQIEGVMNYEYGDPTGEIAWYTKVKQQFAIEKEDYFFRFITFHDNGNVKKIQQKPFSFSDLQFEIQDWYENRHIENFEFRLGLEEHLDGNEFEYYEDGDLKLDIEYIDNEVITNNFWDKNKQQTLIEGNGYIIEENGDEVLKIEYVNGKEEGKMDYFSGGKLILSTEMKGGMAHGSKKYYTSNGKLKQEDMFENGALLSESFFSIYDNPVVSVKISTEDCTIETLLEHELSVYPDKYPSLKNASSVQEKLTISPSIFQNLPSEHIISYYFLAKIDAFGKMIEVEEVFSSEGSEHEIIKNSLQDLEFTPAFKESTPILSYIRLMYELMLEENVYGNNNS